MGHQQQGLLFRPAQGVAVLVQQSSAQTMGLLHQVDEGPVAAAIGPLQFHGLGGFTPAALLLRIPFPQFAAQQTTPGRQIDLQQGIAEFQLRRILLGGQDQPGGVLGAA